MTTDTLMLPHLTPNHADLFPEERSGQVGTHPRQVPFPTRRGALHLIRLLMSSMDRHPAADHSLILGPGGGPMAALHLL